MQIRYLRALTILASVATFIARVGAADPQTSAPAKKPANKILTLDGCVAGDGEEWVLSGGKDQRTYRLKGTDMRAYVGQRVRISGVASRRLRIVGGLYPSPNVAAQAGAIDPGQAAQAAASAAASTGRLPEFDVKAVQPIAGRCGDR
jgi:hypothetical protein